MTTLDRIACVVSAVLLFFIVAGHSAFAQSIVNSAEVARIIENSRADNAFWSVIVRDSTGRILEGYNVNKQMRPASNLKLLTSAAILDELGGEFRFKTHMYGLGYQEGSVWNGDIVIRGSGDPSISGRFYEGDRFHIFEKFYSTLDSLGITAIRGNLIGNTSYFDDQPYPEGWSWDDLSFYYGVEINALSFNNNAVDLEVFADGPVGETPRIQWFPFDTDYVNFINEQVITPSNSEYDEFYRRIPGTNTIVLRSKLPQNYYEKESLSIMDAPLFFMDTLKKYFEDGDIELNGRIIIDDQPKDWKDSQYISLFVHRSRPLKLLLNEVNKESSNFYTEMLLKAAAAEHFQTEGSTDLGINLVKDFAATMGVDTSDVEMTDGSGMSPATLVRTDDLSKLLVNLKSSSFYEDYRRTLSIAGEDGSLGNRFKNSPLIGRVLGKTGYVSGVRSLSGYLEAASGSSLVFSIVTNNYTEKASYIDYVQEKILEQFYTEY